ncbi:MAG: formyltransferase family protein [Ferruginibacter sp.]
MADPKIILLCNSRIALPALRELLFFKRVAAIVLPQKNRSLKTDIDELLEGMEEVRLHTVTRRNFVTLLQEEIERTAVPAVLIMTFPYLIPAGLLALPPKGFINFHYGKLPEYRGPEPIFTQIRMQERNPELSVHIVTEGLDNGPVIMREQVEADESTTYGMLQHRMSMAGAKTVNLLLKIISYGSIIPSVPQDESRAAYHKKPEAPDLMINWQEMDSNQIRALVNACNPWNKGCGAIINDQVIGITEVEIIEDKEDKEVVPGTILALDEDNGLRVAACDGKIIKILIYFTEEGFRSGKKLAVPGVEKGSRFS